MTPPSEISPFRRVYEAKINPILGGEQCPQEVRQLLDIVARNPLLQNVLVSGANSKRDIERLAHSPQPLESKRQETIRRLSQIDPSYLENDWDMDYLVVLVAPDLFDQATQQYPDDLDTKRNIIFWQGMALALKTEERAIGLTAEDQRIVLEKIHNQWDKTDKAHAIIKQSSSTGRPYMVIASHAAQVIVDPGQEVDKSRFRNVFELFVDSVVISPGQEDNLLDLYAAQRGPVHRLTFGATGVIFFVGSDKTQEFPKELTSYTPANIIKGLEAIVRRLDSTIYSDDEISQLTQEEIKFLKQAQATDVQSLITDNRVTKPARSVWRRIAKQIFTRPELIDYYTEIGILPLLLDQPASTTTLATKLSDVFHPDLSSLPPQLREKYQTELNLAF